MTWDNFWSWVPNPWPHLPGLNWFFGSFILMIGMAFVVIVFVFCRWAFLNHCHDLRTKNSKYIEKNKGKFCRINQISGLIALRSGVRPFSDEEWIVMKDTITMKPSKSFSKDESVVTIPFSRISSMDVADTYTHWVKGKVARLRVWLNDVELSVLPIEERLPNYLLPFKPIVLPVAQAIVDRFNEYSANRQKKS